MEEFIESVNTEEAAEPQENVQEVSVENSEVAEPKPVQDKETNAQYAAMRRETEKKAKDAVISEMYGETYGIHTYEDYKAALDKQKAAEEAEKMGVDPDFYQQFNSMKSKLDAIEREKTLLEQDAKMRSDPARGELYKQWESDVKDKAVNYAVDLKTAFLLLLDERLPDLLSGTKTKAEQEAVKKILNNAQSSPGALGSEGAEPASSLKNMSDKDFEDLVNKVKRGEIKNL